MTPQETNDLSVAVFVSPDGDVSATVESILASAGRANVRIDPIAVVTRDTSLPGDTAARTLRVFPLGRGYAKNKLLDDARAPALAFLDDTVSVGPRWVETVVKALARPNVAAVVGPVGPHEGGSARRAETRLAARALRGRSQPSNLAVDCARTRAVGGFPIRLESDAAPYEDLALVVALGRRGWEVAWVPAAAVEAVYDGGADMDPVSVRGRELGWGLRHSRGGLARAYAAAMLHEPHLATSVASRGLVEGLRGRTPVLSPIDVLRDVPAAVSRQIDVEITPLPASDPPKTHLMYAVGDARLLHLYVAPSPRLRRSLAERQEIRARTGGLEGIPGLHAAEFETDAAWVLEDRVLGVNPTPADLERWFAPVARWAVRLAGPAGPPLGTVAGWRDHRSALLAAFPEHDGVLREALRSVDEVPSRHMHGDFQRRNILLSGSSVGLVDWEGAWLHGIPGLDIVFLRLLAGSDRPDPAVLAPLLGERGQTVDALLTLLSDAGAPASVLRPLLVVMLATWALGEERRIHRSRASAGPRPFRALLDEYAPRASVGVSTRP
jgi:hypothetical protein